MAIAALTPLVGKTVRAVARMRGGGTAFPGKVVERLDPGFMARTLAQLPYGVVLVSGTNGKTTTTRIVASLLEGMGLRVFTNPTGSNFTRGVVSALIPCVSMGGRLDADIAVLELDEAYAVHFVKRVKPRYTLLLNVMRDQLDRFGEIDNTARLLGKAAAATTGTLVLNREDPRIAGLSTLAPGGTSVRYFGLSDDLLRYFPTDDSMHGELASDPADSAPSASHDGQTGTLEPGSKSHAARGGRPRADVTLTAVDGHAATFAMDGGEYAGTLRLEGVYNLYNAAAALAVARAVMEDVIAGKAAASAGAGARTGVGATASVANVGSGTGTENAVTDTPAAEHHAEAAASRLPAATDAKLVSVLTEVTPAFGRGESIEVNGAPVELLLVKNPMGFRMSLSSFEAAGHRTMIVINDQYADGRDMSWLWDVDFGSLAGTGVDVVSGVRATDMALRLAYDGVEARSVDEDIDHAVEAFVTAYPGVPKHIYCTYTSMLAVRNCMKRLAQVKDAGL